MMKQLILRSTLLFTTIFCAFALILSLQRVPAVNAGAIAVKETSLRDATIDAPVHSILVKAQNGYVAVYRNGELALLTDIPVASLPSSDRKTLEAGIEPEDETALHQLLEDLGS